MNELEKILRPEDLDLWKLNQEHEAIGLKTEAKRSLSLFITALKSYDENQLDLIVKALCYQRENNNLKIRHNLFSEIICENLIKNTLAGRHDYYRLLATFEQYFYSSHNLSSNAVQKLGLKENYFSVIEVLDLELEKGENTKAAKLLINKLGWHLDYALHELPVGLLYEPKEIIEIVYKIEYLVKEYKIEEAKWTDRLNFVRAILTEWERFNLNPDHENFYDYLKSQNTSNSELILNWNQALYDYKEV